MDEYDISTNLVQPLLGQQFPVYGVLAQVVRVSDNAIGGSSPRVYPAFIQQFVPPLSLRDREPCFAFEPNNVTLSVGGIYDCRLVGAYTDPGGNTFPLYLTTCCPPPSSSSSPNP